MTPSLTRLLVIRTLRSRRKGGFVSLISWFSMLGIMLGVATLILVTSLMNGIREEMLSNFIGVDGHIQLVAPGAVLPDYEALIPEVTSLLPQGATVIPRIEGQVMASGRAGNARGAQVVGLRAEDIIAKPKLSNSISADAQAAFAEGDGVILGESLAESLGLRVGDSVTLISPQGRATAFGSVPRIKAYPIVGTFNLGMHALDSSLLLMPYDDALVYFAMTQKGTHPASLLEITLPDMEQAESVAEQLESGIGNHRYRAYSWQRVHASVFTALEVQRNVMVIILALIIVVAAFNIISSLVMMVKDKRGDVAILRTMGMSRHAIIRMFVMIGMSIGVIGTGLGLVLGLLAAANLEAIKAGLEQLIGQKILVADVYFLSTLPTRTDPLEVVVIVLVSLLLSLLATIYPAYNAASTDPAEALRNG
jgi:lipoprotein-releasing system permease protein